MVLPGLSLPGMPPPGRSGSPSSPQLTSPIGMARSPEPSPAVHAQADVSSPRATNRAQGCANGTKPPPPPLDLSGFAVGIEEGDDFSWRKGDTPTRSTPTQALRNNSSPPSGLSREFSLGTISDTSAETTFIAHDSVLMDEHKQSSQMYEGADEGVDKGVNKGAKKCLKGLFRRAAKHAEREQPSSQDSPSPQASRLVEESEVECGSLSGRPSMPFPVAETSADSPFARIGRPMRRHSKVGLEVDDADLSSSFVPNRLKSKGVFRVVVEWWTRHREDLKTTCCTCLLFILSLLLFVAGLV